MANTKITTGADATIVAAATRAGLAAAPPDYSDTFENVSRSYAETVKASGDYDGDGFQEVYWKADIGGAYLRACMHADGNIQYANYQSEDQMRDYLTSKGYESVIGDII